MKDTIINFTITATMYYLLYWQFSQINFVALPIYQSAITLIFAAVTFALATLPVAVSIINYIESNQSNQ